MTKASFYGSYQHDVNNPEPCEYEAQWEVRGDGTIAWNARVWTASSPKTIKEPSGTILIAPHLDILPAVKKAVEGAIVKVGCG
jgi:hypothetical protein